LTRIKTFVNVKIVTTYLIKFNEDKKKYFNLFKTIISVQNVCGMGAYQVQLAYKTNPSRVVLCISLSHTFDLFPLTTKIRQYNFHFSNFKFQISKLFLNLV